MTKQVYAIKRAMTQTFVEGKRIPLTVLTVEPYVVIGSKDYLKKTTTSLPS